MSALRVSLQFCRPPGDRAEAHPKELVPPLASRGGKLRMVNVLPPTGRLASDFSTLVPAD